MLAARVSRALVAKTQAMARLSTGQFGIYSAPHEIKNEPLKKYEVGSQERKDLRKAVDAFYQNPVTDIPVVIGGKEIRSGDVATQTMPTEHAHVAATYHKANKALAEQAIDAALSAKESWSSFPMEDRVAIYLKAADLLATKYRAELCAAQMIGSGKNVWQAEIDICEAIDFWRLNAAYALQIYAQQPSFNDSGIWNRLEYRPLEGFVFAVTPFNFVAIGANLHSAPALMGNTTIWKPSHTNILSSWVVYKILKEAGLPDGVVNFLPGSPEAISDPIMNHRDLAGLHFTGSTRVFNHLWQKVAQNINTYRTYPRIVGETGGKNFHFVHESADVQHVFNNTVRGAFEYQGQKCSATSRIYVPSNLWPQLKSLIQNFEKEAKVGCTRDFDTFVAAVIDETAFTRVTNAITKAKADKNNTLVIGGSSDRSKGWFVQPTVFETSDPSSFLLQEEFFGPLLTVFVYEPSKYEETLRLCDSTASYALTGSIFAQDRAALLTASRLLRNAAGNFYINDKSTGAVVGQQPFGGSRASGTNDKSGAPLNLLRWVSVRSIKENFLPLSSWKYPHLAARD